MYLTRLKLSLRSAQVHRDLSNPYDMHRTLVRAFVADSLQAPPRILWRAEPTSPLGEPIVLVQSMQAGNWPVLQAECGYGDVKVESKALDLTDLLRVGQRYRFRLHANPTITRGGKRIGIVSEVSQHEWLGRQAKRFGFELEALIVLDSDVLKAHKGQMQLSLRRARFEGILKSLATDGLGKALTGGIGHGKGFGLGLLSLAPI